VAKDPADNAFLECALETGADFLITGNIHHFPVK
jgi:predicted nucleic acid-binding protein